MKTEYFQVVGRGPWLIDYPNGTAVSHRPGQVFEARLDNQSVVRGLRVKPARLRQLTEREASSLRATKMLAAKAQQPKVVAPPSVPAPAPKTKKESE